MRVPLSWLGEWVDLPEDVTLDHVHAALVKVGLEEEDVHGVEITGPLVVGEVLEFVDEPQANGKTIRWCQVDVGGRPSRAASSAAPTTSSPATRSSCRCPARSCPARSRSRRARPTDMSPTA